MEIAIRTRDLVVRYGDTTALAGVTLDVEAATVLGVLGPNGAGKTSLVRVLATQQAPSSGRASVVGFDVVAKRREVQRRIGVTGQYAALDDDLTPTENLSLVASLAGLPRTAVARRIGELRHLLSLPDDGARLGQLSGGTRRRVDLAAGLLTNPSVLMLDEPSTGLDPRSRAELWDVVASLRDSGVTVLLTTQYLEEADQLADRVVFLNHGLVVADGTPAAVKARIGGHVLMARLSSQEDLDQARTRLTSMGATAQIDLTSRRITARTAHVDDAMRLVGALSELGVPVNELQLVSASLDDAFLEVTAS